MSKLLGIDRGLKYFPIVACRVCGKAERFDVPVFVVNSAGIVTGDTVFRLDCVDVYEALSVAKSGLIELVEKGWSFPSNGDDWQLKAVCPECNSHKDASASASPVVSSSGGEEVAA